MTKDDSRLRERFLATLGFTLWKVQGAYQQQAEGADESATATVATGHPLSLQVVDRDSPLAGDICLAWQSLGLPAHQAAAALEGALVLVTGPGERLALSREELASAEGKRRLWQAMVALS